MTRVHVAYEIQIQLNLVRSSVSEYMYFEVKTKVLMYCTCAACAGENHRRTGTVCDKTSDERTERLIRNRTYLIKRELRAA